MSGLDCLRIYCIQGHDGLNYWTLEHTVELMVGYCKSTDVTAMLETEFTLVVQELICSKTSFSYYRFHDVSVFYQNVQELIPFSQLSNPNPMLDHTKIIEIHACIYEQEPDIIILNETWLKSSIIDNEIIPISLYKVFHCDRSTSTHPIDPDNPKKYRRNGGGVLIAIKLSLLLSSSIINIKYKAEFLAIELMLEDKSKIIIATCYRVGTLGMDNYRNISNIIRTLLRKKTSKEIFPNW